MNSKGSMNCSCLIFSLPAVSCNFIFFFCTDPCASRDASQSKQRKAANYTLLESLPLKSKLPQVSNTTEACYHNDQAETPKMQFFLSELACQRHDALSSNGAVFPISHGLFPYKEHIKQPRLRRHGAKTPQKSVFTLFQINFYHSYSISFKLIVKCW